MNDNEREVGQLRWRNHLIRNTIESFNLTEGTRSILQSEINANDNKIKELTQARRTDNG